MDRLNKSHMLIKFIDEGVKKRILCIGGMMARWACVSPLILAQYSYAQDEVNLAPKCDAAMVSPSVIETATDQMIPLVLSGITDPENQSLDILTQCIQQSEPSQFWSDGSGISGDGGGLGTSSPSVRAKRLTNFMFSHTGEYFRSNGRLYDIVFKATDSLGAACVGMVTVEVPLYLESHQNPDVETKDFGFRFSSVAGGENCDASPFNNPPAILSEGVVDAKTGDQYEYSVIAHDPDQNTLTYSLVGPSGMQIDTATGVVTWLPDTVQVGVHPVEVIVTDTGGLTVSELFSVTVESSSDQLSASIVANPASGNAPLTVRLTPNSTTDSAILKYEWDFDGDGNFDRSETVGRDQSFSFDAPGNYTVLLRVTDSAGAQTVGSTVVSVGNEPPTVTVTLAPSNGEVPLVVNFSALATDRDGIALYEWDFDGDGEFDLETTFGSASHTYASEGGFQSRLRVTDNLGASALLTIPTLQVNALSNGSPSVTLTASPETGKSPLLVNFLATAVDPDGDVIAQYEWDFDGDGTFEQTSATNTINSTFESVGTFYPNVRVTDSEGKQSEDKVLVYVEPELSLSVSADTIEPFIGDLSEITTILSGNTTVSLVIETRDKQGVRTLLPFTERAAGTYQDTWDGMDDAGSFVAEGDYRAVLLYQVDGVTKRLDLADTTGGAQSNPPRSPIPSTFAPHAGDPLDITFTLNRASEVTAFMGLFNVNTRLVTFLQRVPLGRGSHQVVWNGENSDGQLIDAPPGDRFLFGVFAYTLPNNTIYVRSGVHVESVEALPSIYQPTMRNTEGSLALSEIKISLSRAGSAKLTINDAKSGSAVAEISFSELSAGENTLTWDGRDNNGNFVAPGSYRLGVTGIAETGFESLTVFALQRIFY